MSEVISVIDDFNQVSLHDPSLEILKLYQDVPEINEIDARGFPICRPLFSHSDVPSFFNARYVKDSVFEWDREFIYSVMLHHDNALAAENLHLIPAHILEQVRMKKCKLILDNTLEGHLIESFLKCVHKSINTLNLPPEQIYYITNNLFAEKVANSWYYDRMWLTRINVISFMYNVHDVQRLKIVGHLPQTVNIQKEYEYKKKNIDNVKSLLKLNRTGRPERNLLMLYINKHKLYENINLSFPEFFPMEEYPENFESISNIENITDLLGKIPFDIDETDKTNHGEPGYGEGKFNADLPFNPVHYSNSFVSLVMGAFPFVEACHLHSSTFNPIYCGHPIIQFGPKGHLKELQDRGFKTFSKWWDEGYDEIEDGWKRFTEVLEIMKKITILDKEQLLTMYMEMIPTLQHNSDLIQNYDLKTNLIDRVL